MLYHVLVQLSGRPVDFVVNHLLVQLLGRSGDFVINHLLVQLLCKPVVFIANRSLAQHFHRLAEINKKACARSFPHRNAGL